VTLGCFAVSVALTGLLQFLISFTMALLAFWVLEVSTFIFILFAFEYIAGGHLFPLDILPPALANVLHFTPFPYQLFFPVGIYLGRVRGAELWQGLAIQAAWVISLFSRQVVWDVEFGNTRPLEGEWVEVQFKVQSSSSKMLNPQPEGQIGPSAFRRYFSIYTTLWRVVRE
jgi:hypothetical protein